MEGFCSFVFVVTCALLWTIQGGHASAIPMWEFLSKEEKMSYLYSMFANQVEEFCDKRSMNNCNQELLKYGLKKLKDMPEDHLDLMDPYQRGANNIIWDSMMEGHDMMKSTFGPQTRTTTTTVRPPKPNSYEDESFDQDYTFGTPQAAASARIDNVYRVPPPKNFVYTLGSGTPQYTYPQNFQYTPRNQLNSNGPYTRFNTARPSVVSSSTTTTTTSTPRAPVRQYQDVPLTGPMVVRVYPDGRPVREPYQPLPQDEDLRQYQMSKVKLPNF